MSASHFHFRFRFFAIIAISAGWPLFAPLRFRHFALAAIRFRQRHCRGRHFAS